MKRVIVDCKKLNEELFGALIKQYPNGYDDFDIITFRNHKDQLIEAIEVKTKATVYLVKVSQFLDEAISRFTKLKNLKLAQ